MIDAGLTTPLAISLATGLDGSGDTESNDEQRWVLDRLLKNYETAIKIVNVETLKGRL